MVLFVLKRWILSLFSGYSVGGVSCSWQTEVGSISLGGLPNVGNLDNSIGLAVVNHDWVSCRLGLGLVNVTFAKCVATGLTGQGFEAVQSPIA